jgi:dCMP deaminase
MSRPTWDEYFIGIAQAVKLRADCTRRQVGAVIVRNNRIVSTGYNGAPAGAPGCLDGNCPRGRCTYEELAAYADYTEGPGKCIAVHAEANAIHYAKDRPGWENLAGATIYSTEVPCDDCSRLIFAVGINDTVCP